MSESASDSVRFNRPRHVSGVELVSVCYRERSFPEHSHGEFVVGAVGAGAEILTVAGQANRVEAGHVLRLQPEEAHSNATTGSEALRYDVLYLCPTRVQLYLGNALDKQAMRFRSPVSRDPTLFATVSAAHAALGCDSNGRLEQESALGVLIRALVAGFEQREWPTGSPPMRLARVAAARDFIDANFASGFGLHDLAEMSGLSLFHFTRSFKAAVGLSPLAYRNQKRIAEARKRLLDGEPIAQVALDVGYADQSHLTRQFQRIVGASPRRYAQQ